MEWRLAVLLLTLYELVSAQVFQQDPITNFTTVGTQYPNLDEDEQCRPIKLRLIKHSTRFTATLVRNTNNEITYDNEDARFMTSRLRFRLDLLAEWYFNNYNATLKVLLAYAEPTVVTDRSNSLHYEGRSARIAGALDSHLPDILHQAALFGFDWVIYANITYCRVSVIPDVCQTNLDLLFLLDQSGSVGSSNHHLALQFIQAVVNFFEVGGNNTRVALFTFSTGARVDLLFDPNLTTQDVVSIIGGIPYRGGWTQTAWALYFATIVFTSPEIYEARPISAGVPRIVVLITDGRSNHYPISQQAINLLNTGATVYSIGIGNVYTPELNEIASDPDSDHVFLLNSYTDAASFVQQLSGTTCDTPANIPPGETPENEVEEDDFKYFQVQCGTFSTTIIIEQYDIIGHCAVYVSLTIINPGPLSPTTEVFRNETVNVSTRRLIISVGTGGSVYISIRGITIINRFRMVVWSMLFSEDEYCVEIQSGDSANVQVIDLNIVNATNDNLYYFNITEGNSTGRFAINGETGVITTTQSLIAMQQSYYELTVIAYLRADDCQRGRTTVKVTVTTENVNPPVFQPTSPVSINETASLNTNVVQVIATDSDFGTNGEVRYFITNEIDDNPFIIDPVTGIIRTAARLNHTITPSYNLTIEARDQAVVMPMTNTTTQVINVIDVNQQPFFLTQCAITSTCVYSVPENATIGMIVGRIEVGDPDSVTLLNGQVTLALNPAPPFSVETDTDYIVLASALDRETQGSYTFDLTATDGGTPPLDISTRIQVTVLDINDNPPVISALDTISVPEDRQVGDTILQVTSSDADIGDNAIVSYSLTGSSLFDIDNSTGAISVAQSLDYETATEHTVYVTASNPDGLESLSASILIMVTNVNDNSPMFTMDTYTGTVTEGSDNGTFVITVTATDDDLDLPGVVDYAIVSGNVGSAFTINGTSGMITVNTNIDREVISEYTLTVRAQDQGLPRRLDTSIVRITVIDINDNAPVFQRSQYSLIIREDVSVPSTYITLLATDADEPDTENSDVSYRIESGNIGMVFNLSETTGVLILQSSLDFESTPNYSLVVVATDNGSIPLSSSAMVFVTVDNVNDEIPILSGDQNISLSESTSVPNTVASFTAMEEVGDTLQFTLTGIQNSEFSINTSSGVVTLVRSLDYEAVQQYILTVTVSDGQFSDSSILRINVVDENDNRPVFVMFGPFTVKEEEPANTLVGNILASDADSGMNAEISFSSTSDGSMFNISDSGQITTAVVLDREVIGSDLSFNVTATDNGIPSMSSVVTVSIKLQDINDNAPVLQSPPTEVNVSENAAIQTVISRIQATDNDTGNNSVIFYYISESSFFAIDNSTGTITLTGSLDYETATEHTINFTAQNLDGLSSPEHSILIRVINENDNSPVFTMNPYTAAVEESSDIGTFVVNVTAIDADVGTLGVVHYSIESGNVGGAFIIDAYNGTITVNSSIDRETISSYVLTVGASDLGSSKKRRQLSSPDATSIVRIQVSDVNDNAPVFQQSPYSVTLREDAPLGMILSLTITDVDEPNTANSMITLSIEDGNIDSKFSLDNSGTLSLANSLDFETQSMYVLTVRAQDQGTPSQSATTTVNITVTNINDLFPVINGTQVVYVSELLAVMSEVANFEANGEEGESLVFSLTGDTTSTFQIDDQSGVVTLARSLDYESRTVYVLQISVSDGLFSSFSTLTVNVLDENDNDPQIAPISPLSINEEMPADTLVGTITAFDADSGMNAQLTFSISPNNHLYINSSTQEIYTANALDREQLANSGMFIPPQSSETFNITATDGGFPMRSAEIEVIFTLRDINDNAPVFGDLPNEVNISESSTIGFEILQVTASDADLGTNAELQFSSMDDESAFIIDDVTGTLSLLNTLDYETIQTHLVNISVTDGLYVTNHLLTIHVLDENDNPPYFARNNYNATVPENSATNLDVITLQAFDADSHIGEFGQVFYALQGGGGEFAIAAGTGLITVNTPNLDRETVSQYTLTAVATDYGVPARSTTTQVVVTISDENDNTPIFQQLLYRSNIREDAESQYTVITVLATDADEPGNDNSVVEYGLNDTSVFTIGSSNGTIKLVSSLNFETTQAYTLMVIATDRGSPSLNGTATVIITVLNTNDEPPMLSVNQSQSLNLSEFTPVTTQIIQYNVTGESANENITFSLNGSQSDDFAIDSHTGVVTLVQSLDYEVIQFYSLNVSVGDGKFVSTSQLNITVLDENDNIPQFNPTGILQVDEEMPDGTFIGQLSASDADSGVNQVITYSFVQSSTANLFTINSITGEILTAIILDRETLVQQNSIFLPPDSELTFQVQATDGGTPSLFSQMDVTIMLGDINDNAPVFVNPVSTVDISESRPAGYQITVITATDADIEENAIILYSLTGSPLFFINSSTGGIFLNGTLDYETETNYTVVVTAANPDGLQSTSHSILIRVTDENDNSPVFSADAYTAMVIENSPLGTFVVNVSATDADSGLLGEVHYSIVASNNSGLFSIAAISGTITVNGNIDREAINTLSLIVRATDLGGNPRSTETTVTVNVLDSNDNVPVLNSSEYTMNISESAEVSSFVLAVTATDNDATSPNNQITYSLTGSDIGHFSIAQNGDINLASALDFEIQEVHSFFAVAVDGGNPSLTSTAEVTITVINENDLPPVVNGDRNISILESTSEGTRITQVTATGEEGETITFSLNITSPFIIDSQEGVISVNETLDFEMTTSYLLQVIVSDGLFTVVHELLVNIIDVNDNTPVITSAGPFMFSEEISLNTSIGNITANDADSGVNAQLTYALLQPENLEFFSINSITGEIFTAARIDRESIDTSNPEPNITITATLQVTDNGSPVLSTSGNVEFHIIEINDNAPQFVNPIDSTDVRETTPVGELVTQVSASDADIGGDPIAYMITGSPLFAINSSTGVIALAGSLDYEMATEHTINVTASNPDGLTSPPHSILVRVINENDNFPVFTMNPYNASVLEGSINGAFVVTVQATDDDSGMLGEVRYSITDGNIGDAFTVNTTNGEITVNNDIDREVISAYMLTVTATDLGIPSRSSQCRIVITIGDINDNSPLFDPLLYTVSVLENVSVNYFLTTVMVTDADIPPNSDITYSIIEGSDLFNISQGGSLFTASSLDFETATSHSIVVQAENSDATPILSALGTVTVSVQDVNDQPPTLVVNTMITVSEQASINSAVTQFSVQDLEVGDEITFQLSGNMSEVFSIDPSTGLLTLAQALDFEMQQLYILLVTANDGIFTSNMEIQINVQDENDNSPLFQEFGPFTIMEELPSDSLVGTVVASDADSGENGNLSYTITRNVANLFAINSTTGEIRTTSMLDRESLVTMNLFVPPTSTESITVQAEDNGLPTLFSQVVVRITLEDINDNSPTFVMFQENLTYPENIFNNSVILEVAATDPDQDDNGIVMYSIATGDPNTSLPFAIDSSTGIVTTIDTLDRETVDYYIFEIVASDNGTVVQSSSIEIIVDVTDINDNPPVFQNTPYMETIPENAATDGGGSFTLLTVRTTDQDIGINADVTYSLAPGTSSRFNIRNETGEFRVSGSINFEEQSEYNVTVIATDGGLPVLTATTIVNIVLTNVDEFAPMFDGPCDANVSEDALVNTVVTRCPATDRDSGFLFYQSFTLSISNVFEIGFETAEVILRQPLDRELVDEYIFTLQSGSLLGDPVTNQIAEMEVTITVLDVNDNPPVFNPDRHDISFNMDSLQSQTLLTLEDVTDADINENGEFSIMMSRNTTDNVHVLTLTAVDMGTPALTGTATVIVTDEIECGTIEFELDQVTREILVFALCSAMNPISNNHIFGTPVELNCQAVTNVPVTYQWQLNGTFITNQSSNPVLDLGEVNFDDVGLYSGIVRTRLGNIQTNTANIGVHTMPVIEGSPQDEAVELDSLVRLSCFASGVPAPDITFYHNDVEVVLDSRVVQVGSFLVITRAVVEDQGTYHCEVTNVVNTTMSNSSMLIVFSTDELVTTTLLISNPNEDGTCHNLDINMIEDIIEDSTGSGAEVSEDQTDAVDGKFCEPNSCYPNPCMNRGRCIVNENATDGYICVCPDTFTGVNCQNDLDECLSDNPCLFESTCANIEGFFQCICPPGREGHRCQYETRCTNSSLCTGGETCVETVVNPSGYVCISTPVSERLRIRLSDGVTTNQVNEALYGLTDRLLELDPNSTDFCEPQFIAATNGTDNYNLTLVWGCPNGTDPLGIDAEDLICKDLINASLVVMCTLSDNTTQEPPKFSLEPISVQVTFILFDPNTNQPLSASQAVQILQSSDAQSALLSDDVQSSSAFQAFDMQTPDDEEDDDSGLDGGATAGIVIAVLIVVAVLTLLGIYVVYKYYNKSKFSITQNRTLPTLQSNVEDGRNRLQTVTGMFDNTAFDGKGKKSLVGGETVFENPTFTDTPVITKLDGNTEPITKSAITRITSEERKPSVSSETVLLS